MHYIGIDIGNTSIRGVLLNAETGRVDESVTLDNDSFIPSPKNWERVQDPIRIQQKAAAIFRNLRSKAGHLGGIGVSGQMHGILYVNDTGVPMSPLYTWQDGRANLPYKEGMTYAGYLQKATNQAIFPGYGLATHFYNSVNGFIPERAKTLCTIHDYIAMCIAGKCEPCTDMTNAASLGLFDIRKGDFDREFLTLCGMNPCLLPRVAPFDEMLGCNSGVPVFPAIGDNQASFLGSVKNIKDTVLANIGTGAQVSCYFDHYTPIPELEIRPFPGGGVIAVGASLYGGRAYALLADFFRKTLELFGKDEVDIYSVMNQVSRELHAENHLAINTQFLGTRLDPNRRGSILEIGPDNFTPQEMIVGFLDGITKELHDFSLKMEQSGKKTKCLTGSGNAVRKNPLLRRILEQRFDAKVSIPANREEASVGAALVAAVGNEAFPSVSEAGSCLKYEGE